MALRRSLGGLDQVIERTLGQDEVGTMSEYLIGAVANEFTLNVAQADKVTVDMTFVAIDNQQRLLHNSFIPMTEELVLKIYQDLY